MKLFSIYLFCIALLTYHGLSIANNIKKDLLNQSNSINQAVTSYSQYLQTLNWFIMKYLKAIILFLLTRINLDYKNFNGFYDSLEDETIEIVESMEHYYLTGLLNYSYGGCLDYCEAEQLLNEHCTNVDDYIESTNDDDLTILGLISFLGY